jgi:hypothetical protein
VRVKLDKATAAAIREQQRKFREKFGRDLGPDDPIFFDPNADTPQFLSQAEIDKIFEELLCIAKEAGMPPEWLYASRKTGRMVTTQNRKYLTPEELAEWNAAIAEYKSLN